MKNKIVLLTLLPLSISFLVGCEKQNKSPYLFEKDNLHYQSSDKDMETFLNDFAHRNLRYDEDSIGTNYIGNSTGFAKNWDTMGIVWHNNSDIYIDDRYQKVANYLASITQDELGMIYNTHNGKDSYFTQAGYSCHQGWPFPFWKAATNSPLDLGQYPGLKTMAFEFNGNREEDSSWNNVNGNFKIRDIDGYATFSCSKQNTFRFYKSNIDKVLTSSKGINTRCAPFVEIDMSFNGENVKDYYVIYKTKEGGDTWFKSAQKTYATNRVNNFANYNDRQYLALYLNEQWDKQIITDIGIEFVSDSNNMTIKNGIINYIRPNYDTRQSNATLQWLLALNNYISYTRDLNFLKSIMPKARRAMLFLLHALKGEEGLIDVSYLYGHNGIGLDFDESGDFVLDCFNGVANGWWDVSVNSEIALEPNIYFYEALNGFAKLEQMVIDNNLSIKQVSKIRNKNFKIDEDVIYNYSPSYFSELASTLKARVEQEVNPVFMPNGLYKNEGGFYYSKTGRFVDGINEKTGKIHDYGNTAFNEQAVAIGLGNKEQQLSIMKWIDGQRIVSGDLSKGDDIYFYEFAPRAHTVDAIESFNFTAFNTWIQLLEGYDLYNRQVQDGGATMMFSYYDLVARAKVLGAENAYRRLDEIKKWYMKILNSEYHGYGTEFYNDYYMQIEAENIRKNPDQEGYFVLQNSERVGAGTLGLDGEFLENVIMTKSIPDAFMGMIANDNTLELTHRYDSKGYLQVDNCSFIDCSYSMYVDKESISIKNIKGLAYKEQKIKFIYPTSSSNPKVYLDNKLLKQTDYEIVDGNVVVVIDFDNHTLKVK